ncbi:LOW QUALITY PROTEIN: Protein CBG10361 [Caenorhabditis briggsae]|uniref:Protein CBG10361 n=1 Tax=Caenorhabditis briggsae TaxID=6238 RepID=A8XB15_CAEBR|nr:LOW QUALITY PROTEIN: Protein CBG10361 [Caenorhabditis briggsae]CAP29795.1 Protein CBG10361 [Caenorhabditis briggsae]
MASYVQLASTCVSLLLNLFLCWLIWKKSPNKMGSYKQLMVTSVFEMYYAMLDGAADVTVFAHGFAVVVFREYLPNSWVPSIVSMALVIAYCVTFGMCMAILASHFMYRYSVTDSTFHHCYLSGKKYYLLFMAPFVYAIWWTSALLYGYSPNAESDEYLKARFLDTFDLRLDQISYVSPKFYRYDSQGSLFNSSAWIAVANCLMMVTSSIFFVLYLGSKCYLNIRKHLSLQSETSKFSANLQKQIFNALVIQTIIPVVLMYLLILVFFLCPMINVNLGYSSRFVSDMVALYPVIDPLPNMFIIKTYRKGIIGKRKDLEDS